MAFLKLSVGFSLLRIGVPSLYTRMLWSLIGKPLHCDTHSNSSQITATESSLAFVCLYTVISWGEWFAVCKPLAGFWNKDLKPTCLPVKVHKGFALLNTCKFFLTPATRYPGDPQRLTGSHTGCNILTDICFATIPVPIILGLQMKQKTRIYLICVLSLGYM
jgi:hypothetical protein